MNSGFLQEKGRLKVSHFNEKWDDVGLINPEIFTYKSFDGVEIEAALLKPAASKHPYQELQ